jgi:8-amino-7-oxononanoate synthase
MDEGAVYNHTLYCKSVLHQEQKLNYILARHFRDVFSGMESLDSEAARILNERKQSGNLRSLTVSDPSKIDFSSNDYLGLARSTDLQSQIHTEISQRRLGNGATGSRLLTGNSAYTQELEEALARLFHGEACLIFNSGYAANTGILSALPKKSDTILYDELSHASIKDGIRLSLATRYPFRHNDLNDLENKITRSKGRIYVVAESVYSMNGDESPLEGFIELKKKYNFEIIIDEAHSTGIFGMHGEGLCVSKGFDEAITARVYTFGKALGSHGACVVTTQNLKNYLINFSRPLIYSTALSPHTIASIRCGFDFIRKNSELNGILKRKTELFIQKLRPENRSSSTGPIQTVIFTGNENCKNASRHLNQLGFDVRPIMAPTVPIGEERLRICIHSFNTDNDIVQLASAINELKSR